MQQGRAERCTALKASPFGTSVCGYLCKTITKKERCFAQPQLQSLQLCILACPANAVQTAAIPRSPKYLPHWVQHCALAVFAACISVCECVTNCMPALQVAEYMQPAALTALPPRYRGAMMTANVDCGEELEQQ